MVLQTSKIPPNLYPKLLLYNVIFKVAKMVSKMTLIMVHNKLHILACKTYKTYTKGTQKGAQKGTLKGTQKVPKNVHQQGTQKCTQKVPNKVHQQGT